MRVQPNSQHDRQMLHDAVAHFAASGVCIGDMSAIFSLVTLPRGLTGTVFLEFHWLWPMTMGLQKPSLLVL